MKRTRNSQICLIPKLTGVGGMASFQDKLVYGLSLQGVEVNYDLGDPTSLAVLVVGGTRNLLGLWRARRRGARIVQRLDGMNWIHRARRTGVKHFLRAEYGNMILRWIRSHLADEVIYQSNFTREWWERACGAIPVRDWVIYNGVDLDRYTPCGQAQRPEDRFRLQIVEGSLGGGYEVGLESAMRLTEALIEEYGKPVELVVVGKVSSALRERWQRRAGFPVHFSGQLPREQIPNMDRSAHVLYSADIHAACPNSVIEALACGLPVVGFDTGALSELVTGDSGRITPYGGNAWRLDPPDIPFLARATVEILEHQDRFRHAARARAEEAFGLDKMVASYLDSLLSG